VVEIDYNEPALLEEKLNLIGSGNAYSGVDRFTRIVDQRWHGASDVDRYKYGYDRASLAVALWNAKRRWRRSLLVKRNTSPNCDE
jgi:hypothetical protein